MRQLVGGAETNSLWDENSLYGDVLLESDGTGAPLASYVLGGPELLSHFRGGTTSHSLADAQGSTRALTNAAGAITDRYDYSAFGEMLASTGTSTNAYLYTGQQFDALTGLYNLRARYYQPALGRFLSRDPIAVQTFAPLELNRYVYAANDPVNLVDPRGRDSEVESAVLALVAFTAARPLVAVGLAAFAAIYVPWMVFGIAGIAGAPPRPWPQVPALPRIDTEALRRAAEAALALVGTITGCAYLRSLSLQMAINHEGQGLVAMELALPSPNPCHIPVLMYSPVTPAIAQHIQDAQNTGRPMLLVYNGPLSPLTGINRNLACPEWRRAQLRPLTCDEYPFASTSMGGASASTRGVPAWEYPIQGWIIRTFYAKMLFKPGFQFGVVVVPF